MEPLAGNAAALVSDSKKAVPPAPPTPPGVNLAVGLGLNLQRASLDNLPEDIQMRLIQLSDDMDKRQYDYYCQSLSKQADYQSQDLDDRGKARKQALLTFGLLGGGCLVFLGIIVYTLLNKEQFEVAQIVVVSSLTFLAGMFGGSGLPGLLKHFSGGPS